MGAGVVIVVVVVVMVGDSNALPVLGSSIAGDAAVIAVVGPALAGLPPAPPNAGNRGVEYREEVDSREAREPGRSGDECGRPGAVVAGKGAVGKGVVAVGGGGDGVRIGEGTGEGGWRVVWSSGGGCSGATGAWAKSREREDGPATGVVEFDPERAAGKCRELGARAG